LVAFYKAQSDEGGSITNVTLPSEGKNVLMPDVVITDNTVPHVTYRKFFIKNVSGQTLLNVKVYISQQTPSPYDDISIALGTATDTVERAKSYNFVAPTSEEEALLAASTLEPNDSVAVWVKRTIEAGAKSYANNSYSITVVYTYVI